MELLSNVGQIILGAGLLSAVGAYLLREYEQMRQRRRELRGLLRLMAGEIAHNASTIEGYGENPRVAQSIEPLLKTKEWDENRVSLAQLMKSGERFDQIFNYYEHIALMERSRLWKLMSESEESREREKGLDDHVALNRLEAKLAYQAIEKELEWAGFDPDEIRKLEKQLPEPSDSGSDAK